MSSKVNSIAAVPGYPYAGRRNSVDTMRDNFSSIAQAFSHAKDEINDLQTKIVLKSSLSSVASNNYLHGNSTISSASFQGEMYPIGTITYGNGSVAISESSYHYYKILNTTGNIDLEFGQWSTSLGFCWLLIEINVTDVAYTLKFPNNVTNITTLALATEEHEPGLHNSILRFPRPGRYFLKFTTTNGGETISVYDESGLLSQQYNRTKFVIPQHTTHELSSASFVSRPGSMVINSNTKSLMYRTDTSWHPLFVLTTYAVEPLELCETTYEGNVIYFNVVTSNIPNETTLFWTLRGDGITNADFNENTVSGNVRIVNNSGNISLIANIDSTVENVEKLYLDLRTSSITGNIVASTTKPVQIINV